MRIRRRYTSVFQILYRKGPQLSSAIAAVLVREGASAANARKIIQRAHGILRLTEVSFPHRESFLYLPDQHNTQHFWDQLLEAFKKTNSVYGYAINALLCRDGFIPAEYFAIVCGSPTQLRGHLSAERVRDGLQRLGLITIAAHPSWGSAVSIQRIATPRPSLARARILTEDIVADSARTFMQRLGLGSYGKIAVRSPKSVPAFGAFKWDITAPCYINALRRFVRGSKRFKPGFMVADILLGVEAGIEQVKPFLAKAQVLRSNPRNPLFLSMLVADSFSEEALREGKGVGHLMVTTEALFSRDLAEALRSLIQVLTNAATAAIAYPELVYETFDQISVLEGSAASMRGPLLELWLARLLHLQGWTVSGIGKQLRVLESGEIAEADVLAEQLGGMRIRACEAKAHVSPVSEAEIRDWLTRQVPRMRRALLQLRDGRQPEISFEFWTTNVFSPEALEMLRGAAGRTRNYQIRWFEGAQLSSLARETADAYLLKILNDFFFRNTTSARLTQMQRRRSQLSHLASGAMPRPSQTAEPQVADFSAYI